MQNVFWCFSFCHHAGFIVQTYIVRLARFMNFEGRHKETAIL
jgi:hypothetical protein